MRETPANMAESNEIAKRRAAVMEELARNRERVGDLYASADMQRIYRQLRAATFPSDSAILHKQRTLRELRERKLLDETLLRKAPAVYVGSGFDFEYPVLMGARRVMLVDPILSDERARKLLIERVEQISPVTETAGEVHFEMEFEPGEKETVTLEIRPEMYGGLPTMPHTVALTERFESFQTDEPISLLLGFRTEGMDIDTDPKMMDQIAPGGIVIADHMSSQYLHTLSDEEKARLLHNLDGWDIRAVHASLQQYWDKLGFDFVPLQSEGDSYHYTCLRKKLISEGTET